MSLRLDATWCNCCSVISREVVIIVVVVVVAQRPHNSVVVVVVVTLGWSVMQSVGRRHKSNDADRFRQIRCNVGQRLRRTKPLNATARRRDGRWAAASAAAARLATRSELDCGYETSLRQPNSVRCGPVRPVRYGQPRTRRPSYAVSRFHRVTARCSARHARRFSIPSMSLADVRTMPRI